MTVLSEIYVYDILFLNNCVYFMLFGSMTLILMQVISTLILKSGLAKDSVCYSHQNYLSLHIYIILYVLKSYTS